MHLPPPPDSRELLPPLLACLPTAFVSPQPPPALLPLLSPLLRQRLSFMPSSTDRPRNDGWLSLLSWDAERAAKLGPIVERIDLEPHPVSGEVEMDEVRPARYRRLDEETLQARLEVEQFELLPIYVWCETDEHGGTGPGWKLAEVRSLEDLEDGTQWYNAISEANDAAQRSRSLSVPQISRGGSNQLEPVESMDSQDHDAEEDDDDYWASYDRTPGRTPAQKRSPAPTANASAQQGNRQRTQSELDYYARYGHEVQPAMDSHDPDEEHPEVGESTLNGDSLLQQSSQPQHSQTQSARPISRPNGTSMFPADTPNLTLAPPNNDVEAPRPISPTSSHSSSVERLEARARVMSEQEAPDRAQIAIQQHISTDIKSLFRLARSSGMERPEFERIVKTELDCLRFLEQDE